MQTIDAIYEHGILRPLQKLELPEHAHVALAVVAFPDELMLAAQQEAAARHWDDPALDVYNE
jgi:predicted DNA-binding antitoxin AbrB/MazE fold protein